MVVLNQDQKPVLIADIEDDRWADEPDKRQRADTQMRQRYDQMLRNCPIHRLYGLSLLGTSLRVYCGDKVTGELTPRFVGRHQRGSGFVIRFLGGTVGFRHLVTGRVEEDTRNCCVYRVRPLGTT